MSSGTECTSSRDHLPDFQTLQILGQSTWWAERPDFQLWASVSPSPRTTWAANVTRQRTGTQGEQRLPSPHTAGFPFQLPKGISVRNITGECEENPGSGRTIAGAGELITHLPNLSPIPLIQSRHRDYLSLKWLARSLSPLPQFPYEPNKSLYKFPGWISLGCCVN